MTPREPFTAEELELMRRFNIGASDAHWPATFAHRLLDQARAYLSLLEAVEPLLAAAEKATPGPWDAEGHGGIQMDGIRDGYVIGSPEHRRIASLYPTSTDRKQRPIDAAFIVAARNTASALRDLLGPTGGEA